MPGLTARTRPRAELSESVAGTVRPTEDSVIGRIAVAADRAEAFTPPAPVAVVALKLAADVCVTSNVQPFASVVPKLGARRRRSCP